MGTLRSAEEHRLTRRRLCFFVGETLRAVADHHGPSSSWLLTAWGDPDPTGESAPSPPLPSSDRMIACRPSRKSLNSTLTL